MIAAAMNRITKALAARTRRRSRSIPEFAKCRRRSIGVAPLAETVIAGSKSLPVQTNYQIPNRFKKPTGRAPPGARHPHDAAHLRASPTDRAVTSCNKKGGRTQGSAVDFDMIPNRTMLLSVERARLGPVVAPLSSSHDDARSRRFPPPWLSKRPQISDANGQALASLFRG
jgi:hypothetical protein